MTYCFGLVSGDHVNLIADSAVTSSLEPTDGFSTFGELHSKNAKGLYVEEAAVKIARISDDCAVAMAGNAYDAIAMTKLIAAMYKSPLELPKYVENAWRTVGPLQRKVELLFAFSYKKDRKLAVWDSNNLKLIPVHRSAEIGGPPAILSRNFAILIEQCSGTNIFNDDMLAPMMATLQNFSVQEAILQSGVGGVIAGCSISSGGFSWAPDTDYFIMKADQSEADQISVFHRLGGIVVVTSRGSKHSKFFPGPLAGNNDLKKLNFKEIMELAHSGRLDRSIIMHQLNPRMCLIPTSEYGDKSLPYRYVGQSSTSFSFEYTRQVRDIIFGPRPATPKKEFLVAKIMP